MVGVHRRGVREEMQWCVDVRADVAAELDRTGHVAVRAVLAAAADGQGLVVSAPLRHARDDGVAQVDRFQPQRIRSRGSQRAEGKLSLVTSRRRSATSKSLAKMMRSAASSNSPAKRLGMLFSPRLRAASMIQRMASV